jgi:steroid delta-isomerase-like uncharacterized protein
MTAMSAIDAVRDEVESFNAGDWDRLRATLADDAVYEEPATQRTSRGAEDILSVNRGWKEAFPDARGTIVSAHGDGEHATVEIVWEGTHSGTLSMPMGDLSATGRRISIRAAQVGDVRDGKVTSLRHYFDLLGLLAQLGALRQPSAAQAG